MRRAVAAIMVAVVLACMASADVIRLKDGRKIEGKIVTQTKTEVVVQVTDRIRMTLRPSDIKSIEKLKYDVPVTKTPTPRVRPTTPTAKAPPSRKICFIQVVGAIEQDLMPVGIKRAILDAKQKYYDLLVVELDTPGGRTDLAEQICSYIERCGLETVAFVRMGQHRGAFSAGAIIALSCDRIYMAPGTSIGAATPYVSRPGEARQVTEKMISAFSAIARTIATRHKHPPDIAAAMVDPDVELREVKAAGRSAYLPPDRAAEEEKAGAQLGGWLTRKGKLLTMTSTEAYAAGFIEGVAASRKELVQALGIQRGRVMDSGSGQAIQKAVANRASYLRKLEGAITMQHSRAQALDPRRFTYKVYTLPDEHHAAGEFIDGGQEWRVKTDICVRAYDTCLNLCRDKLKLARKYPDLRIDMSVVMNFMVRVKATRDQVAADRGRQGLATSR